MNMRTQSFNFTVQRVGAKRDEQLAGFKNYADAERFATDVYARDVLDQMQVTTYIWNETAPRAFVMKSFYHIVV